MDNLPRSRICGRTGFRSSGKHLDDDGNGMNLWGSTTAKTENDSSDSDEKSNPDLSDALRLHRQMIREMKRKHRISASRLRRGKSKGHQYAYQVLLNDNFTSCSESLSFALDQLSVATPNWSVVLPGSPDKRPGSIALSPSFVETISPSFPQTVEESSSTGKEVSWKQVCLDGEYDDEDFSRLFRREEKIHPKKPQSLAKSTGLAGVREEVDDGDDDDQDDFFDSCEVAENDEEEVDEFFDCVPTPEKKNTNEKVEADGHKSNIDTNPTVTRLFTQQSESEKIIFSPTSPENRKNDDNKSFLNSYSNNESLQHEIAKETFDKNIDHLSLIENTYEVESHHFVDTYTTSFAIDTQVCNGNISRPSLTENDEDKNDAHIFQRRPGENAFKINDSDSFVGKFDNEDESEHFVDTHMKPSASASILECGEENEDEAFFDFFSDAESLKKDEEKKLNQNNLDDMSSIHEIDGDTGEHSVDASVKSKTIDTKNGTKRNDTYACNVDKNENSNLNERMSQTQFAHHLDYMQLDNLSKTPLITQATVKKTFVDVHSKEHSSLNSIEEAENKDLDVNSKIQASIEPRQHSKEYLSHQTPIESSEDDQCKAIDVSRSNAGIPRHNEKESSISVSKKVSMFEKDTETQVISLSNPVTSQSLEDTTSTQHKNPTKLEFNARFVIPDSDNRSPLRMTLHEKAMMKAELSGRSDSCKTNIVGNAQKVCQIQESGRQVVEEEALNLELMSDGDKQIIDDILGDFFEEFNAMETETPLKKSQTKSEEKFEEKAEGKAEEIAEESPGKTPEKKSKQESEGKSEGKSDAKKNQDPTFQEDDNIQANIFDETIRKRGKSQEVADFEEMTIEPISIFDDNPYNLSMVLINEPNSELSRVSEVPTPIKNEVKEIDDMLNDFLQEMAAIDDGDDKYDDYDQNCTEDEMSDSTPRIDFESSTLSFEDSQRASEATQNTALPSIIDSTFDCSQNFIENSPFAERAKSNPTVESEFNSRSELGRMKVERSPNNYSEQLPNGDEMVDCPLSKLEGRTSTPSFIIAPSDHSSVRPAPRLVNSHPGFTLPSGAIAKNDDYQDRDELQIDFDENPIPNLSFGSEMSKSNMETDFVLPSFTPPKESRSRITSPELNQSVRDNSRIFLSTNVEIISTRPNDPVATALSRDSSEDETDIDNHNIQDNSDGGNFTQTSSETINNLMLFQEKAGDFPRPKNPVSSVLSRDLLEDQTESIKENTQNSTDADEFSNKSSEAINTIFPFQSSSDHYIRPNNPVATSLSQDSSRNESDAAEMSIRNTSSAKKSSNTSKAFSPFQAINDDFIRCYNLFDNAIVPESFGNETNTAEESTQEANKVARELSEVIIPAASSQVIRDVSSRPKNPVATALCQDLLEGKTDAIVTYTEDTPNDTENISHKETHLIAPFQAISDDTKRLENLSITAFAQDRAEDFEKESHNLSNTGDVQSKANDAMKLNSPLEVMSGIPTRSTNPGAIALSKTFGDEKTDAFKKGNRGDFIETSSNLMNSAVKQRTKCEIPATPSNPVASTLSQHLLEKETDTVEKGTTEEQTSNISHTSECEVESGEAINPSAQQEANCEISARPNNPVDSDLSRNLPEKNIGIQNNSTVFYCTDKKNEISDSFSPPQRLSNNPAIHGGAVIVGADEDSSNDLLHFDQGSVSTISPFSLQSQKVKMIDVDSTSQLELPILLSYSCDSNSSPRKSPARKIAPVDPDKSFRSIASPPPIPKKESALAHVLGVSASKPNLKSTQNDTPIRSNPPKIPFSRTRERLEGSPSRERRARASTPSSPHRIETSRSPLFFDRGDGKSSTSDSTVRWYTSPGRSRSPATPLLTPDNKTNCPKSNRPKNNRERLLPPGNVTKHNRSGVGSPGVKLSNRKETKRSSARSEATQSTMNTYASPNRSTASSMRSPLRGFYSLSNPPRSPAVSLFSRMPKGARSAIRRLQKSNQNNQSFDEATQTDFLSTDTVRVCTNKFVYKIHSKIGPCDRCWALASEEEREVFMARGSHLRITKTRSGCDRTCSIFPPAEEKSPPVRLCRRCFFATHQQGEGGCKLQVYRGNSKVRPSR